LRCSRCSGCSIRTYELGMNVVSTNVSRPCCYKYNGAPHLLQQAFKGELVK
jgi:hypothetical protein